MIVPHGWCQLAISGPDFACSAEHPEPTYTSKLATHLKPIHLAEELFGVTSVIEQFRFPLSIYSTCSLRYLRHPAVVYLASVVQVPRNCVPRRYKCAPTMRLSNIMAAHLHKKLGNPSFALMQPWYQTFLAFAPYAKNCRKMTWSR